MRGRRIACVQRLAALAAALAIGLGLPASPAGAVDACSARPPEALTYMGRHWEPNAALGRQSPRWELTPPFPDITARHYMVRLLPVDAPPDGWSIAIRDANFRLIELLGPGDFAGSGAATGRWTRRIDALSLPMSGSVKPVFFDLSVEAGLPDFHVRIIDAIVMPEAAGTTPRYSLQVAGDPHYADLFEKRTIAGIADEARLRRLRRTADRVGMMIGRGQDRGGRTVSWCCSGVMLTGDLYLTNWHCGAAEGMDAAAYWPSDERCAESLIDTSWDGDAIGRESTCTRIEAKSEALDYALIRVAPVIGASNAAGQAERITFARQRPASGDGLVVLHHAVCKPKLISFNCPLTDADYDGWRGGGKTEFTHRCDTEGGSSGAPIFNESGALVGLHHLGFGVDTRGQCDRKNKAVHIGEILADIQRQKPDIHQEIIAQTAIETP